MKYWLHIILKAALMQALHNNDSHRQAVTSSAEKIGSLALSANARPTRADTAR